MTAVAVARLTCSIAGCGTIAHGYDTEPLDELLERCLAHGWHRTVGGLACPDHS